MPSSDPRFNVGLQGMLQEKIICHAAKFEQWDAQVAPQKPMTCAIENEGLTMPGKTIIHARRDQYFG